MQMVEWRKWQNSLVYMVSTVRLIKSMKTQKGSMFLHILTLLTFIKMISGRNFIGVNLYMSSYSLSSGLYIPI